MARAAPHLLHQVRRHARPVTHPRELDARLRKGRNPAVPHPRLAPLSCLESHSRRHGTARSRALPGPPERRDGDDRVRPRGPERPCPGRGPHGAADGDAAQRHLVARRSWRDTVRTWEDFGPLWLRRWLALLSWRTYSSIRVNLVIQRPRRLTASLWP